MPAPVSRNLTTKAITLSATKSRSGEVIREESKTTALPSGLEVETLTNPAHVATELSITKNMQNFESMKIGVIINSPCANTDADKLATHERDIALAMKMLEKEAAVVSSEWF